MPVSRDVFLALIRSTPRQIYLSRRGVGPCLGGGSAATILFLSLALSSRPPTCRCYRCDESVQEVDADSPLGARYVRLDSGT